ncbi:MAG: hypothetical protein IMZ52_05205 [Actinobacteria bacterium]|nr:hypothetical protein [Actinomycetota bacterium]MBE3114614.1 hypothetical protein [Actinomycetota bacterium]
MPTERQSHNFASHYKFPYWFANAGTEGDNGVAGINFSQIWKFTKDLVIYYGTRDKETNQYVEGWCTRWDVQDYDVIVSTFLSKADLQILKEHIRPGAVKELYKILGKPKFYDSSWQGFNTLLLVPNIHKKWNVFAGYDEDEKIKPESSLNKMRNEKTVFVKNITENPMGADTNFINIKLDCCISGGNL